MMKRAIHNAPQTRARSIGLTLVEVMVAMVIGLIILAALSSILINNLRTSREIEQVGRHVENGRFAVQTMIDDLSNAGFYGGATLSIFATEVCNASKLHQEPQPFPGHFVIGDEAAFAALDCAAAAIKPGTGWLAVRRYTTSGRPSATLQSCPVDMTCVQVDPSGSPKYGTGNMDVLLHDGKTYAAFYVPVSNIYYVDENDNLHRISLDWSAAKAEPVDVVLVEGIEMLGFIADGQRVTINLLSRAERPTANMSAESKSYPPFMAGQGAHSTNDNVRRNYYSVAVNIYNP